VKGMIIFVLSSPWLLIVLAAAFIVILEVLVRRYSFAYRKPLLYSVLVLLAAVLVGTYAIAQTGLHQRLMQYAEEQQVPLLHPLYRDFGGPRSEHVHVGIITDITHDGFVMTDRSSEVVAVTIADDTRLPRRRSITIDDRVVVMGEKVEGAITAFGVRPVPYGKFDRHKRDRGDRDGMRSSSRPPALTPPAPPLETPELPAVPTQ
jgi:hypothetical protein